MKAKYYLTALFAAIASGVTADENAALEACRKAVVDQAKGEIVKIELKNKKNVDIYDIDVNSDDGVKWEIKCDKASGRILEKEQELPSADHPAFAVLKRIDEEQARKIALEAYPGTIREVEYEIEENGAATYEFDIEMSDGRKMEVDVDAAIGSLIKAEED